MAVWTASRPASATGAAPVRPARPCRAAQVMDYYDGNTVTGLWNYAQHFAMSDDTFGVTFGPSSPGAINLAAGDTGRVDMAHTANSPSISTSTSPDGDLTADGKGGYSLTNDAQPYWDDCSTRDAVAFRGQNIGDLLNRAPCSPGVGSRAASSRRSAMTRPGPGPRHRAAHQHVHTRPVQDPGRSGRARQQPGAVRQRAPGRRRARRHRSLRLQGRLHPPSRAVPVLRLDGQPAPSDRRRLTPPATTRWPA